MTKKLFVPAYKKSEINPDFISKQLDKIPKPFFLAYSIQFKEIAESIKKSSDKKDLTGFSQVLGCSKPIISKNTKSVLLIGSGRFHGVSLALETGLNVYVLEPGSKKLSLISEKEIQKLKQLQKSSYTKFLNSKSIGILVSLKPGQNRLKKALELKKTLEKSLYNKEAYIFIADNLNLNETENFHGIDSWINTACPRLSLDKTDIVNLADIIEYVNEIDNN